MVVHNKTGFFINKALINGLNAEYLKRYEEFLNQSIKKEDKKIHIVYIPVSFDQLIPSLIAGKGDIAADLLTITENRKKRVRFASGDRGTVSELLVTHSKTDTIKNLDDLAGQSIYVIKGSSYVEHLQVLNKELLNKGLEAIKIKEAPENLSSEDIMEMVNAGIVDLTVVDDFRARLWAKVLPGITIREDIIINQGGKIGWAVRLNNPQLQESLNQFALTAKEGSLLGNMLFNRFYKNIRWIKNPGTASESQKFGQFVELFKKYGEKYNFDYLALIAQAYQESGLNQKLKSPSGAIGIMQLLPSTAADRQVNIPDIDQLENNIHAATKYLNFLRTYYFSEPAITPDNQLLLSWAAYNAGPGNVKKMRRLAEQIGLDKNKWFRNVEIAAGRIIGTETVRYVSNIYKYHQTYLLLKAMEKKQRKISPAR